MCSVLDILCILLCAKDILCLLPSIVMSLKQLSFDKSHLHSEAVYICFYDVEVFDGNMQISIGSRIR